MPRYHPLDDAAIEAFFTGQTADEALASLAGFVEDLHSMTSEPAPVPSMQLAAMLAAGFSTAKGDLLATAASNVTGPAPQAAGLPKWRKKKMIVAELLAGLSVAAKAAFGVSAAAAAVTAGGAAGVLPGPAQHAVATSVEAVTPFSFPDKANAKADFGGTVSTDAGDGGVDGKTVSAEAQLQGEISPPVVEVPSVDAGPPADTGRPAAPGQKGLDQANTTPAAGRAPTAVPGGRPATAGTQSSAGLATAGGTPAAGRVPTSVPAGPPATTPPASAGTQSSAGLSTAGSTPAAGFIPASAPPARPGR